MQSLEATLPQISESVAGQAGPYRDAFVNALAFKHVMIENFFEPGFAERLLHEFPNFDPKLAMKEMLRGWRPGKALPGWVRLAVGDVFVESLVADGTFEVTLKLPQIAEAPFRWDIDTTSQGRAVDSEVDSRELAFRVAEIRAKHPLVQTLTKMQG
jgi:hypothetical protein